MESIQAGTAKLAATAIKCMQYFRNSVRLELNRAHS